MHLHITAVLKEKTWNTEIADRRSLQHRVRYLLPSLYIVVSHQPEARFSCCPEYRDTLGNYLVTYCYEKLVLDAYSHSSSWHGVLFS